MSEINSVLQAFGLAGTATELKGGYSGEKVYLLQQGTERYVIKGGRNDKTFIHSVLIFLQGKDFELVPKVHSLRGSKGTFFLDGDTHWEVDSFMPGCPIVTSVSVHLLFEIGKAVAQFHACLARYPVNEHTLMDRSLESVLAKDGRLDWWNGLTAHDKQLFERWGLYDGVKTYVGLVEDMYRDVFDRQDLHAVEASLPKSVIHRDLYGENIFSDGSRVTGIIDFDLMRYGCRIDDIYRIVAEFGENDLEKISKLLQGYTSVLKLDVAEKEQLKFFLYVRYLRAGFYMLEKSLELQSDLADYPESLQQRLDSCIDGVNKLATLDLKTVLNAL